MKKIRNKFIKKIKIFLTTIFIIFLGKEVHASNFQYTITEYEKIKITEFNYLRLLEYSKGDFYSKTHGSRIFQVKGLYFALSEQGNVIAFSFCDDDIIGCNENLLKYQTKATCESLSKEKCNIIAIGNNLILNRKIIPIINNQDLNKHFAISKDNSMSNLSYEIRAQNLRDAGNDDYQ